MRLVTHTAGGRTGVGVRRGDGIVDTGYDDMHGLIRDVALEAPLRPRKILCSGVDYGFRDPPVHLKPSDTVTVSVDRIGDLTNPVEAGW